MIDKRLLCNQFLNDLHLGKEYAINNIVENVNDDKIFCISEMFGQAYRLGDENDSVRNKIENTCIDAIIDILEDYSE